MASEPKDPKVETPPDSGLNTPPTLSKAEVAKKIGIPEAAIFDFKDHGNFVRAVTVDGCKLDSGDKEGIAEWKKRQGEKAE